MGLQRILVTGATGFVGRHLVAHLLSERRPLTLAVRKADGCPACWRNKDHVRIVETGAIERCSSLENALSDVSIVVHAAGLAHVNSRNARDADALFMRANAEATEKLAQAVVRSGARQFITLEVGTLGFTRRDRNVMSCVVKCSAGLKTSSRSSVKSTI